VFLIDTGNSSKRVVVVLMVRLRKRQRLGEQAMPTPTQTTRLIPWVIVGLIALGALLHLFGPAELENDELVVIGILIIGLIWFQVWLRRRGL
jgi:hypothetical protein